MNDDKLVRMANEIAAFFAADADQKAAEEAVASHLARFWDPRMRRQLARRIDDQGPQGVHGLVLEAFRSHRDGLVPRESPKP